METSFASTFFFCLFLFSVSVYCLICRIHIILAKFVLDVFNNDFVELLHSFPLDHTPATDEPKKMQKNLHTNIPQIKSFFNDLLNSSEPYDRATACVVYWRMSPVKSIGSVIGQEVC